MNTFRLEGQSLDPTANQDPARAKAEKVAAQFEDVFVKTFISSMRQTASIGEQSMFGSGPGSDTYAGWFDQNIASELGREGGIGIAQALLEDMERHGDIGSKDKTEKNVESAERASALASNVSLAKIDQRQTGGIDGIF